MLTRRVARVHGLREAALSLPLLGPLPGDLVKLILRLHACARARCAAAGARCWRTRECGRTST